MILALSVVAQARPAFELSSPAMMLRGQELCYPSGLRVVAQTDRRQPVVSLTAVYDAGSADDAGGRAGTAHLLEHLTLRGPRAALLDAGASYNGLTWPEATLYTTLLPVDQLERGLAIEGARLVDPLAGVSQADLEVERAVIAQELNWRGEHSYRGAMAELYASLYPKDHPFHRGFASTGASMAALSLEDVRAFAEAHYRPDRTTLHITGDRSPDELRAAIEAQLPAEVLWSPSERGPGCAPRPIPLTPLPAPPAEGPLKQLNAAVATRQLYVAWALPGGFEAEGPVEQLAVELLEIAVTDRLGRVSRRPTDSPFYVDCGLDEGLRASTATCWLELPEQVDPDEVLATVYKGLSLFSRSSDEDRRERWFELARASARNAVMRDRELGMVPDAAAAQSATRYNHFTGKSTWFEEAIELLDTANEASVSDFAERYFRPERAAAVLVVPGGTGPQVGQDADLATAFAAPNEPKTAVDVAKLVVQPDASQAVVQVLPNGLRVVTLAFGSAPVSRAALVLDGGTADAPTPQLAELTARWSAVNDSLLGIDVDRAALRIGGERSAELHADHVRQLVSASSGNVDDQLYLLYGLTQATQLDVPEPRVRERLVGYELRDVHDYPGVWAGMLREHHVYGVEGGAPDPGTDPFAHQVALKSSAAKAWWKRHWSPTTATVYVVSPLDPRVSQSLARRYLPRWEARPLKPEPPRSAHAVPSRAVYLLDASTVQTEVSLSCRLGEGSSEAGEVLASIVDEQLWMALREESGSTYTPHIRVEQRPDGQFLHASALVEHAAGAQTAQVMLAALDRVSATVPGAIVERAKVRTARHTAVETMTSGSVLDWLIRTDRSSTGLDGSADHGARLAAVDARALAELTRACGEHEVLTLVGPAAVLRPRLETTALQVTDFAWKAKLHELLWVYDPEWMEEHQD